MCVLWTKEENLRESQAERVDRSSAITSQSKCDLFPMELFQYEESWPADGRVCTRVCVCVCVFEGRF